MTTTARRDCLLKVVPKKYFNHKKVTAISITKACRFLLLATCVNELEYALDKLHKLIHISIQSVSLYKFGSMKVLNEVKLFV